MCMVSHHAHAASVINFIDILDHTTFGWGRPILSAKVGRPN